MNDVSANLPVATPATMPTIDEMTVLPTTDPPVAPQPTDTSTATLPTDEEKPSIPEEGLERTPGADSVELGANCSNLKALKTPSPQQVVEGLSTATTIAIALKSFIQSLGDLWHTTKDNFNINKEKAVEKQMQKNNAAKMDVAA